MYEDSSALGDREGLNGVLFQFFVLKASPPRNVKRGGHKRFPKWDERMICLPITFLKPFGRLVE